jgi:hypothetical protein
VRWLVSGQSVQGDSLKGLGQCLIHCRNIVLDTCLLFEVCLIYATFQDLVLLPYLGDWLTLT